MTPREILIWEPPKIPLQPLAIGELHLWKIDVETSGMDLSNLLSPDERLRCQQMLNKQDQLRFSNARGSLRTILAAYLDRSPETLRFDYGAKGKPELNGTRRLHFNLTHAGNLALVAVSAESTIGIDLEKQQPRNNLRAIARRVFSDTLWQSLETLENDSFQQAFFQHWTQMEARVKALGQGVFSRDTQLANIACVNFTPEEGWCAAVAITENLPDQSQWLTLQFSPDLLTQIG
ncbi:MAG: 4'-phosphopantetheinyl transferase superfamily protein [Sedimenticola sp.]|mgnify:CR=1 FL=1|uniref:4'-phosphopantetheinyl transferase superfamily protein n=1 Tax=Sedimenticola thiotaurini TaxID=1543721 RepID=A0A558CT47_9GAMM|nr:4'-phosphopantetheinyl transferase superfamily protein [Sedimenticola sp.]MCW8881178.1 4'-phosphopantetheinyl transferase superfamily protein [Sedimenticola sp.]MCW8920966.1 4'-phosphopantetheinyl transferase superfamily protein [Sedimenticola sp.]MCW9021507.1 4'-phosphopantetheinyl transferase superfamily protein [Sedimenticola sp.]TVT51947.1 MAG: 4'-phosphopantetheinyl transferase superfamily protein [Sedimenticola thiotaurini]